MALTAPGSATRWILSVPPGERVTPPCRHFGPCGGCLLQDVPYSLQLDAKRAQLQRWLAPDLAIEIIPAPSPYRYRNKMEFTFGQSEGRALIGLHTRSSYRSVVDITDCHLVPAVYGAILADIRQWATAQRLTVYRATSRGGCLRHLIIRSSQEGRQVLVCVLTAEPCREATMALAEQLMAAHPEVRSVYWGLARQISDVAVPQELHWLRGARALEEQVGPFRLEVQPFNFAQPCTAQAARMYQNLQEGLPRDPDAVGWDLYTGTGLMALFAAQRLGHVIGMEREPQNVTQARQNAERNGVANVTFLEGSVERLLADRTQPCWERRPRVITVDPPRGGLHRQALQGIVLAYPPMIAYLSCNPVTLVRDVTLLQQLAPRYRIVSAQAYDMFPQTDHLETLLILQRS